MAVQFDLRHLPHHETEHGLKVMSICKVRRFDQIGIFNLNIRRLQCCWSIPPENPKGQMSYHKSRHRFPSKCVSF